MKTLFKTNNYSYLDNLTKNKKNSKYKKIAILLYTFHMNNGFNKSECTLSKCVQYEYVIKGCNLYLIAKPKSIR